MFCVVDLTRRFEPPETEILAEPMRIVKEEVTTKGCNSTRSAI
jgi:hypothetical protein